MNKHILLVMKWLADKNSVSKEELEENNRDAEAARAAAAAYNAATYAAYAPAYWAYAAVYADAAYHADVAHWIDEYFEVTGEDKEEYLKELEK